MAEDLNRERNPETLFEVHDASVREVVLTGAGIGIGVLIVCIVIWGLFNLLKTQGANTRAVTEAPAAPVELPPQPRLQVNAPADLAQMRAQEDAILNNYGWVNKNAGTVRIPIDEAMNLVLKRGLPARTPAQIAAAEAGHPRPSGVSPTPTVPAGAAVAGAQPEVPNPATAPAAPPAQRSPNEKK